MARSKQYNEQEVLEKSNVFVPCNGMKTRFVCVEKEMGINQFSTLVLLASKDCF
jgi:hypothetical protein